jgi:predicted DNA-binding transcriptional regulator AlpA
MKPCLFSCTSCHATVEWIPVSRVAAITGVDRRTVYNWMNRDWIHTRTLPSGRRIVCLKSLTGLQRFSLVASH